MTTTLVTIPLDGNGKPVTGETLVSSGNGYVLQQAEAFYSTDTVTGQPISPSLTSTGGIQTVAIAASKAANTVVKASAGRLCRVLITTTGTNALVIYDNASTASGTIICSIAASAAAGTLVDFQMPAANGITVAGNAANPAVTISFS